MKIINIRILFFIVLFCGLQTIFAQMKTKSIVYGYGVAGNRTCTQLIISKVDDSEEINNITDQQLIEITGDKQITIPPTLQMVY